MGRGKAGETYFCLISPLRLLSLFLSFRFCVWGEREMEQFAQGMVEIFRHIAVFCQYCKYVPVMASDRDGSFSLCVSVYTADNTTRHGAASIILGRMYMLHTVI